MPLAILRRKFGIETIDLMFSCGAFPKETSVSPPLEESAAGLHVSAICHSSKVGTVKLCMCVHVVCVYVCACTCGCMYVYTRESLFGSVPQ